MPKTKKNIYYNVPIQLIASYMDNSLILSNVIDYAFYNKVMDDYECYEDADLELISKEMGIQFCNYHLTFTRGEALFNQFSIGCPKVGISKIKLFEFRDEDKSDFEKVCFLAYLALKSILQQKAYVKMDNKYLLARMDGKPSSVKSFEELSSSIYQFANEYQLVKIKNELQKCWGLKHYSRYTRGFYVSFSMELEILILEAEKKRKSFKDDQLKQAQKIALENVMKRLNATRA